MKQSYQESIMHCKKSQKCTNKLCIGCSLFKKSLNKQTNKKDKYFAYREKDSICVFAEKIEKNI